MGKTGGGSGTNQYRVKGQTVVAPAGLVALLGHVPVLYRGQIYWQTLPSDPATLAELATYGSSMTDSTRQPLIERVHAAVASHPHTPLASLRRLAQSAAISVRLGVAQNPSADQPILDTFARDRQPGVRIAAAAHPRLSPETLREMAGDQDPKVRATIAARPDIPDDVLRSFLRVRRPYAVRTAAISNPKTPPAFLLEMAQSDNSVLRAAVTDNRACPSAVLALLVGDEIEGIRQRVWRHPNLPDHLKVIAVLSGVNPGR